jgi:HK97 family phage major capsid protein
MKRNHKSLNVLRFLLAVMFTIGAAYGFASGENSIATAFLIANVAVVTLDEKQLSELKQTIEEKTKAAIEAEKANDLKKYDELTNEIKRLQGLEDVLKKQGEELELMKKKGAEQRIIDFKTAIYNALQEKHEEIKEMFTSKKSGFVSFDVKAAGTITFSNVTGREMLAAQLEPGYTDIATRRPYLLQLFNRRGTTSKTVHLVDKRNRDGSAAPTAEGGTKPLIDFDFVEVKVDMKKIPAAIKVSTEMLDDIAFMRSAINEELITELNLTLDEQLLSGDDSGANLQGVLDKATAFSAGSLASTVDNANNFDVIRAAVAQIVNANFIPNFVCLNPYDAAAMDLTKGTDGHYIMPPFSTVNGQVIAGVRVIENPGMTAGDYLIGDFSKGSFYLREGISISVGWENDDFRKNLVTILGEMRGNLYISENNTGAFVTGDFATDKAALETP